MKKVGILTICTIFCFAFASLAFAVTPNAVNKFEMERLDQVGKSVPMALIEKMPFKEIVNVPKWTKDESTYPNNSLDDWPDPPWDAEMGALDAGVNTFTGNISEASHYCEGGFCEFTGDTDILGFNLPGGSVGGLLSHSITFNPDCNETNIYYYWIIAHSTGVGDCLEEMYYLLDLSRRGVADICV